MDLKEIKRSWPLAAALAFYGLESEARHNRPVFCPFHGNKNTPAAAFYDDDSGGHIYCFREGRSYDVIDLVVKMGDASNFMEAVRFVAERGGMETFLETFRKLSEIRETFRKLSGNFPKLSGKFPELSERFWGYMDEHGIGRDLVEKWEIGLMTRDAWAVMEQKFSEKELRAAGLLSNRGNPMFVGRIIFPVFGQTGEVVSFVGRALGESSSKWVNANGMKRSVWFGVHNATSETVVVVEGPSDVIALDGVGVQAVAALGSSAALSMLPSRYSKVTLALDADDAGAEGTLKMVSKSSGFSGELFVATLASGDPASNPEAAKKSIESAVPVAEWLAANVERFGLEKVAKAIAGMSPGVMLSVADYVAREHGITRKTILSFGEAKRRDPPMARSGNAIDILCRKNPVAALGADQFLLARGLPPVSPELGDISHETLEYILSANEEGGNVPAAHIARAIVAGRLARGADAANAAKMRKFLQEVTE